MPGRLSIFKYLFILLCFTGLVNFAPFTFSQGRPKPCTVKIPLPENRNPSPGEFRFAAVGDTGTGSDRQIRFASTMFRVWEQTARFDALLFLGDNVYPSGDPADFPRKLYSPYQLFRDNEVEIRGVIGNHDARNRKGVEEQIRYFKNCKSDCNLDTYYKFSGGGSENLVEFFALDSNLLAKSAGSADYTPNTRDRQIKWFEEALAQSRARWKIVLLHHPLYSSAKGHGAQKVGANGAELEISRTLQNLRLIDPLLQQYGISVVLAGHDHLYERIEPRGRVFHFTSGAGAKLRKGDLNRKRLPIYHACGITTQLSFMLFSVEPGRLRYWAIGENGNSLDSGEIAPTTPF